MLVQELQPPAEMPLLSQALQLPAEVQLLVQKLEDLPLLLLELQLPAEGQLVVQELQLAAGRDLEAAEHLALVVEDKLALVVVEELKLAPALVVEELELAAELALLVLTNLKTVHSPQPQVLLWLCLWQPDDWRGADHAWGQGQVCETSDPDLEYQYSGNP